MIFDWEGGGSRRTASTLFGFLESFGNEIVEPATEKEFGGLCCHGLIVTLKMEGTKRVIISGILPSLTQPFSLFFLIEERGKEVVSGGKGHSSLFNWIIH